MSNKEGLVDYPLLEIEILQLSNLFGNDADELNPGGEHSALSMKYGQSDIDDLGKLDLYRIARDKQHEIFVRAAFRAYLGRDPDKDELARNLETVRSSSDGFRSVVKTLTKQRDVYVALHNETRKKSIVLTLGEIDRWSGTGKSRWWK